MYKYENNIITNIPFDKIEALANVYKTTPAYIMGWDNISVLHEAASERVGYEQWLASGAKTKDLLTPIERKLLHAYTQLKENDDTKDRADADAIERLLGLSEQQTTSQTRFAIGFLLFSCLCSKYRMFVCII